ncbi:hypothetical protein GWG65_35230 [Bradyrhizobium sp. CSA207]|uniref:hypothetical protein n=1 Tax=Bradyrhizobium sp. CSA207 TaxID=2698826 RepID=UPI0023AF6E3A|nr:hypothetical protein [Bradyrhizobium sp. CSA207]MDE5446527.1 hypothetical protein [Bradyrhizobium sp. CSA207]
MIQNISLNLEPYEWRQSLRAEHERRNKGRGLQVATRVLRCSDFELLNTDAKLDGLTIHLSVTEGEPPLLEDGIGSFVFIERQRGGYDYGPMEAMVNGRFFLDSDLYNELWSQVAADCYSNCTITATVGPVPFRSGGWEWDVKASKKLRIEDVSVTFSRVSGRPVECLDKELFRVSVLARYCCDKPFN